MEEQVNLSLVTIEDEMRTLEGRKPNPDPDFTRVLDDLIIAAIRDETYADETSNRVQWRLQTPNGFGDVATMPAEEQQRWDAALKREVDKLTIGYGTFEPATYQQMVQAVKSDPRTRVVPSTIVMDVKYTAASDDNTTVDENSIRERCRWVSCEKRGDFVVDDTYSPTATMESMRLVAALACEKRLPLRSYDVSGA